MQLKKLQNAIENSRLIQICTQIYLYIDIVLQSTACFKLQVQMSSIGIVTTMFAESPLQIYKY